jgi:hypothetical protein
MTSKKTVMCLITLTILFGITLLAQNAETFKVRLAPAPALGIQPAAVVGIGSATATLTGRKLAITGSFEKMASAPTAARLGTGQLTGVRGTPIFDLTVSKDAAGTSGKLTGNFDLTAEQVDMLKKGRLYIQVHSEGAPNGHLLGWILK